MEKLPAHEPDWRLLRRLDARWRRYVEGEAGNIYQWLTLAVRLVEPRRVLELGAYTGASTLMLYSGLPAGAALVSVDIERDHRFVPPEVLADPRVRIVIGNDLDLSIYGGAIPEEVDFLFIDTEHSHEQISREWRIYRSLLAEEALVVLDDIRMHDMFRFWEEVPHEKCELTHDCHQSGFGVFLFRRGESPSGVSVAMEASRSIMADEERSARRSRPRALRRRPGRRAIAALKRSVAGALRSNRNDPVRHVAEPVHVREVSLHGAADLDYWQERLRGEKLTPLERQGKARVLIVAASMRYLGVRFTEVSFSILLEEDGPSDRDAAFLAQAFTSSRLFAFCERRLFGTPYRPAACGVSLPRPVAIRIVMGGELIFQAGMPPGADAEPRQPSRRGEERWEGSIFLPRRARDGADGGRFFLARLQGFTSTFPFVQGADTVSIRPRAGAEVLQALVDSRFVADEWAVREDATHSRSRTHRRSGPRGGEACAWNT